MIATGVVRGVPVFRPRTVIRPLRPSGTPARNRDREMGLNTVTHDGGRLVVGVVPAVRAVMVDAPRSFGGLSIRKTRRHSGT
jgi:hypothetical protein